MLCGILHLGERGDTGGISALQIAYKGKNIDITDALREHAESKISKVEHLGVEFREIEVKLVVEKNPKIRENQTAELTAYGNGPVMRATDRDHDMYTAIDKAVSKLQRQIKKYHQKQIDRTQSQESALRGRQLEPEPESEAPGPSIVKTKNLALKPMAPEEATLQMEMLGHDFFVFVNQETDEVNIVYRRKDGNFGLIDTTS